MNIFREMAAAIWKFDYYPNFLKNRRGKVFGFSALLVLFSFLAVMCFPAVGLLNRNGGFSGIIQKYVPDFTFENNTLTCSKTVHYENGDYYVDVNTDPSNIITTDNASVRNVLAKHSYVLLMNSTGTVYMDGLSSSAQELKFSDPVFSGVAFNKQGLLGFVPYLNGIFGMVLFITYWFYLAAFFFQLLFIAMLGKFLAAIYQVRIGYGQVYCLSIYTRTLPTAISLLSLFFPVLNMAAFYINFFIPIVYLGIIFSRMRGKNFVPERTYYMNTHGGNPQQNYYPPVNGPQQNTNPQGNNPQQNTNPQGNGPQQNTNPPENGSQQNYYPPVNGPQQNTNPQGNNPQQNYYPQGNGPQQNTNPQGNNPQQNTNPPENGPQQNYYPQGNGPQQNTNPQGNNPQQNYYPPVNGPQQNTNSQGNNPQQVLSQPRFVNKPSQKEENGNITPSDGWTLGSGHNREIARPSTPEPEDTPGSENTETVQDRTPDE